jgi:DNA-binding GntR family transcriptional regulator
MKPATSIPGGSPLQRNIAAQIVQLLQRQNAAPGSGLTELGLAQQLGVSRTPVRAALRLLESEGLVTRDDQPAQGKRGTWRVGQNAATSTLGPPPVPDTERLFIAIARDRIAGVLPGDVSEADLLRRYDVSRPTVLSVMTRLAEVGQVERKTGHGWTFAPATLDAQTQDESYRFRLVVEPAALLEPGYRLDPAWAADMRARHRQMLDEPWHDTAAVALFDLNAAFHEGLAAGSGNRFLQRAVAQQNRLRRFVNVDWQHGPARVRVSCIEHLGILDQLEAGHVEVAAALLRQHLQRASTLSFHGQASPPAPDASLTSLRATPTR